MRSLALNVLFVFTASAVDCSQATPWTAQVYATPKTAVVYENQLYTNNWYAESTDVPGAVNGPWAASGACDAGSAPSKTTPGGQTGGIDCSQASVWTPKVYSTPNTQVVYESQLYANQWYAESTDVPGAANGPWAPSGACAAGSEPSENGAANGAGVDCTGVYKWHPDTTFAVAGEKTHYKHALYESKWWIKGTPPSSEDGFTSLGSCITGTDSLGFPEETIMTAESEKTLCTCCKQCANKDKTTPICMDDITDQEDCYYAWCPNYNNYNEAECATIIEDGKLGWYSGEMLPGKEMPARGFMPYIDVTLGKVPNVTDVMEKVGVSHYILAFVVSATNSEKCKGAWAGVIDIGTGPNLPGGEIPIYSEINRLRKLGGDVVVSFGGANGIELADSEACQAGDPVANLKKAYTEVLDMLKLKVLDFDIEGNAVGLAKRDLGWKYRFAAVKELEAERPDLQLWWTLPVLPTGLVEEGLTFITDLFAAGVRFDRLNLMTMDYGELSCTKTMHECEVDALTNVAQQVFQVASAAGQASKYGFNSAKDVYPYLGTTPMIGVNDVTSEVYTLENARQSLALWKSTKPLGLLSMWSLARDSPCSSAYADPSCSSGNVQTEDFEYSKIYAGYPSN